MSAQHTPRRCVTLAQMRARRDFYRWIAAGFDNIQMARDLRDEGKHSAADFHAMCAGIARRHAATAAAVAKAARSAA
ncbi:hypothetical protein J7E62_27500 [Variovorax paradoxus]|nr:hypothetical protein [Variovorax paradoxus]